VGFFHSVTFLDFTGPKTTIRGPCPLVKILSECQTAWIRVRRRVTRRLTRNQAVCIWDYGRDRPGKV